MVPSTDRGSAISGQAVNVIGVQPVRASREQAEFRLGSIGTQRPSDLDCYPCCVAIASSRADGRPLNQSAFTGRVPQNNTASIAKNAASGAIAPTVPAISRPNRLVTYSNTIMLIAMPGAPSPRSAALRW